MCEKVPATDFEGCVYKFLRREQFLELLAGDVQAREKIVRDFACCKGEVQVCGDLVDFLKVRVQLGQVDIVWYRQCFLHIQFPLSSAKPFVAIRWTNKRVTTDVVATKDGIGTQSLSVVGWEASSDGQGKTNFSRRVLLAFVVDSTVFAVPVCSLWLIEHRPKTHWANCAVQNPQWP